jgi:phosphopantothenoylcysteine decarboxylase/phosphopantothenate--cysteine ligase
MQITIGVTGGVAAYKAAEIVRRLQQEGFEVQTVMTRAAQEFVAPLTFAALTGRKVITELFEESAGGRANVESAVEHIAVAQLSDLLLVAPATADVLAKMAHGLADDFLTTLYLAMTAPVVVAPAMNVNMWEHAATQENVGRLRKRGVRVIEPDEGYLACGMTGAGRLASLEAIIAEVKNALAGAQDFRGQTVLVTAGPTHEAIDPVRYLGNRSSGRMGYALAEAAARRGAQVILVSGPTALEAPAGVRRVQVRTAEEMHRAVLEELPQATMVIKAAAVADYRPAATEKNKIKGKGRITLELEPTADILADVARQKGERVVVGFAAETEHVAENAREKLAGKNVDLIVANDVMAPGAGFDQDTNEVTLYARDGREQALERMSKRDVAERVLDEVLRLREARRRASAAGPARS